MTVFTTVTFYVMRQIYRVDAAFGQTGRMDAAWNRENADFRQKVYHIGRKNIWLQQ